MKKSRACLAAISFAALLLTNFVEAAPAAIRSHFREPVVVEARAVAVASATVFAHNMQAPDPVAADTSTPAAPDQADDLVDEWIIPAERYFGEFGLELPEDIDARPDTICRRQPTGGIVCRTR